MKKTSVMFCMMVTALAASFYCSDKSTNGNSVTTFSLTMTNDGHGTTTPSDTVTVNSGAATSISATPAAGYQFLNWTVTSGTAAIASSSSASTRVTLTSGNATIQANFAAVLDMTVVGKWQGAIGAIPSIHFNGAKIFANFSGGDSSFSLITRDTTRGATPVIKDTTLVLTGSWRLNAVKDTILLASETCRVVDTTTNDLSQRQVQGQIIPIPVNITKQNGQIIWKVPLTALVPLAPLIGLDLSGVPQSVLQVIIIELQKMSQ